MLNKQETLKKVAEHLHAQGGPARDLMSGRCRYRAIGENDKALMCAVGCLIDDGIYANTSEKEQVEGLTAHALPDVILQSLGMTDGNRRGPVWDDYINFLRGLQEVHDCYGDVSNMGTGRQRGCTKETPWWTWCKAELTALAHEHKLDPSVIPN